MKSLAKGVKAGHEHTHSLVQNGDNGLPVVSSMSPGPSTSTDHRAATAQSSISPTQSLIITPQQTPQETAVAPESTGSGDHRGSTGSEAWPRGRRRQEPADVPWQDTWK